MARGRQRHDWSIASALMALVANTQRDPKKSRPFRPGDFDPFSRKSGDGEVIPADVSVLKDVFIHRRPPGVAAAQRTPSKEANP